MATRDAIVAYADELLDVDAFPEYGRPGLQVVGADEVSKLVCGVSCSKELFEQAGARGAQLVLVHHGLFWRNEPLLVDRRLKGRLGALLDVWPFESQSRGACRARAPGTVWGGSRDVPSLIEGGADSGRRCGVCLCPSSGQLR